MQKPKNFKEGDQFRVIEGSDYFSVGDIISLKKADDSNYPYFWNVDKSNFWSISFSKLEPYAKTIRDAQVDDIVIGKINGFEYMVLERGQRTVLLSYGNNFKNSMGDYTFDRLEEYFTLKADPKVGETLLTMDQIAEKFGIDVSKLKIAKD